MNEEAKLVCLQHRCVLRVHLLQPVPVLGGEVLHVLVHLHHKPDLDDDTIKHVMGEYLRL